MKKFIIVLILIIVIINIYSSVNYSLLINFKKSENMRFFILATSEDSFSIYGDQFVANFLNRQGFTAEYVPDNTVLTARLMQEFYPSNPNNPIPDVYVITQKYYLVRSASERGLGNLVNEVISGVMIDIRQVSNPRFFDFDTAVLAAQAELFEKDEMATEGMEEVLTKVLNDIFSRMK